MIVGLVFEILLLLALLGGGKDLVLGFLVATGVIAMGWKLRTYGKGIRQQEPASATSEVGTEAPPPRSPTVELPFTPAISAAFIRQVARWRRITAIIMACGMTFFLVPAAVLYLAIFPTSPKLLPILLAATGLFFGLVVGGIHVFQREIPVRRDLRDSTCLRTSGPPCMAARWCDLRIEPSLPIPLVCLHQVLVLFQNVPHIEGVLGVERECPGLAIEGSSE